jgi:hypothetical protein
MNLCLIPCTRPDKINKAVKSAEQDGWNTIVIEDFDHNGMNVTREKLLDKAFNLNSSYIRFLDDDDILLPHLNEIKSNFQDIDIIYTNYFINDKQISLSGHSFNDTLSMVSCNWIAKTETLERLRQQVGFINNPKILCRSGGWVWYLFLLHQLKIKHIRINSHIYNKTNSNCVSSHPDFEKQTKL